MILIVQTNIPGRIDVWTVFKNQVTHRSRRIEYHGSEFLLALINKILTKKNSGRQMKGIIVVQGPGPFTAVRTGIVVANTLGLILRIPIEGIHKQTTLENEELLERAQKLNTKARYKPLGPWYGKQPNITKSK